MSEKVLTQSGVARLWAHTKEKAQAIADATITAAKDTTICPLGDDGKVPTSNLPEGLPATIDALTDEEITALLADDPAPQG